jgi:mono/diheme cytochrome c family protein
LKEERRLAVLSQRALLRFVAFAGSIVTAALVTGVLLLAVSAARPQDQQKELPEQTRLIQSLNGANLFQAYCATCHGKDAKSNGPAAASLKNQPPDLTRIGQRNGGKFPIDRVQKIIAGDDGIPAHGSRAMPIWGPIFSQIAWDQDLGRVRIYNLAKYLESLQQK